MTTTPATATARTSIVVVWAVLSAATVVSWLLGHGRSGATLGPLTGAVLLLVAVAKVHLLGTWFMELRHAPRALRLLFGGWCVLLGGTLVGLYLLL